MKNTILTSFLLLAALSAVEEKLSPQDTYDRTLDAYQQKKWKEVVTYAKDLIDSQEAAGSPYLADLTFYTGVAYFHREDYDLANEYFSMFLAKHATPKFFEEAVVYKYKIAEKFETGAKKHIFGSEKLPKWVAAWEEAYTLYDEVINTLPRHEIAASALFHKGSMLWKEAKYKESVDAFQMLIRRFSKHPLAPESYLLIGEVYLEESEREFPDRDLLEQARLNYKKFTLDFPGEKRLAEGSAKLRSMVDRYARDLWESASFFEKKGKVASAVLYYQSIVQKYPESQYAEEALKSLEKLKQKHRQVTEDVDGEKVST
jgi:outer membrane assembly lipoprotein YfiO